MPAPLGEGDGFEVLDRPDEMREQDEPLSGSTRVEQPAASQDQVKLTPEQELKNTRLEKAKGYVHEWKAVRGADPIAEEVIRKRFLEDPDTQALSNDPEFQALLAANFELMNKLGLGELIHPLPNMGQMPRMQASLN